MGEVSFVYPLLTTQKRFFSQLYVLEIIYQLKRHLEIARSSFQAHLYHQSSGTVLHRDQLGTVEFCVNLHMGHSCCTYVSCRPPLAASRAQETCPAIDRVPVIKIN